MGEETMRPSPETHPAANVRSRDSGCNRQQGDCARYHFRNAQERHRKVLWRRYFTETETPRETKRGEKTYETGRAGGNPAGSVPGCPGDGRLTVLSPDDNS